LSNLNSFLSPKDEEVYKQLQMYFDYTKEILLYSEPIFYELNKIKIKAHEMDDFKNLIMYCFLKSTSHGMNIWIVASSGHYIEASILLRPIIELIIQLKYIINKGRSNFIRLSKEFFIYLRYREKNRIQIALNIATELKEQIIIDNIKENLNRLNAEFKGKKNEDFWPGQKLKEIAIQAGLLRYYQTVYDLYSKYIHSSLDNLYQYYNPSDLSWNIKPSTKHIDEILITFFEAYFDMMTVLATEFWGHPFTGFDHFDHCLNGMKEKSLLKMESKLPNN